MKKFFEKLSLKFFDFISKNQEGKHQKIMNKLNKNMHSASFCGSSVHANSAAMLSITSSTNKKADKCREKIEAILDLYYKEPKKLFDYIQKANTPVFVVKNITKILNLIHEKEGFILPKRGIEAFYLNFILNKKISFKTSEMFLVSNYDVDICELAYQFHNWYCYKMGLDGYDAKTQEHFKHVFEICETSKIDNLSFQDVISLKTAVRRDIEAIEFVQRFVQKKTKSKKNLDEIKQGKIVKV